MKKFALLILLLTTPFAFAQKKEKIKGSKNVTTSQKEIGTFDSIDAEDNIELYLVKGGSGAEIEADDNLHDVITAEVKGSTLRIYTNKNITAAKKIAVRLNCPATVTAINVKHEAILYALTDFETDSITIKTTDYAKLYLNVKAERYFALNMNDKATAELNLKTKGKTAVELSKNAELKALVSTGDLKLDMYQKTSAAIEGDAATAAVRLDNQAEFTGKKFTVKNMELTTESYAKGSVMVEEKLTMSASGRSVTEAFGNPDKLTIVLKKFAGGAVLAKKEDKDK